jgi:histidinol dehydrogenase
MAQKLLATAPGFSEAFSTFVQKSREEKLSVDGVVADIIADVKARGDAAVVEYSKRFDGDYLSVQDLAFSSAEIADAAEKCDPKTLNGWWLRCRRPKVWLIH